VTTWNAVNGSVGASHGYSLYPGNSIDAEDKDARERLLRYCLRAPLSLERLSVGQPTQRRDAPLSHSQRAITHLTHQIRQGSRPKQ